MWKSSPLLSICSFLMVAHEASGQRYRAMKECICSEYGMITSSQYEDWMTIILANTTTGLEKIASGVLVTPWKILTPKLTIQEFLDNDPVTVFFAYLYKSDVSQVERSKIVTIDFKALKNLVLLSTLKPMNMEGSSGIPACIRVDHNGDWNVTTSSNAINVSTIAFGKELPPKRNMTTTFGFGLSNLVNKTLPVVSKATCRDRYKITDPDYNFDFDYCLDEHNTEHNETWCTDYYGAPLLWFDEVSFQHSVLAIGYNQSRDICSSPFIEAGTTKPREKGGAGRHDHESTTSISRRIDNEFSRGILYEDLSSKANMASLQKILGNCTVCPWCLISSDDKFMNCSSHDIEMTHAADVDRLLGSCPGLRNLNAVTNLIFKNHRHRYLDMDQLMDTFPSLIQLDLSRTNISFINGSYVRNPDLKLIRLRLNNNPLESITPGVLDRFLNVSEIYVAGLKSRLEYRSLSWTFCYRYQMGLLRVKGRKILLQAADLSMINDTDNSLEDAFCDNLEPRNYAFEQHCRVDWAQKLVDCADDYTSADNINLVYCKMRRMDSNLHHLRIRFPAEKYPTSLEDLDSFGLCPPPHEKTQAGISYHDNVTGSDHIFDKTKKVQVVFSTVYDLNNIEQITSDQTKLVKVYAEIVYMTKPLEITYDLRIFARIAYLNSSITMTTRIERLLHGGQPQYVFDERLIEYDGIMIKSRKYIRVHVMDTLRLPRSNKRTCDIKYKRNVLAQNDEDYFDLFFIKTMHDCDRSHEHVDLE